MSGQIQLPTAARDVLVRERRLSDLSAPSPGSDREQAPNQSQNATPLNPPSTGYCPFTPYLKVDFSVSQPSLSAGRVPLGEVFQQGQQPFVEAPNVAIQQMEPNYLLSHGQPAAEPQVLSSQHGGLNNSYQSLPQSFESLYLGQFTSPLSQISPAGEYGDALSIFGYSLWY